MLYNVASTLRVIWACMKKDIKTSFRERTFTIVGTLVPINFLFLMNSVCDRRRLCSDRRGDE